MKLIYNQWTVHLCHANDHQDLKPHRRGFFRGADGSNPFPEPSRLLFGASVVPVVASLGSGFSFRFLVNLSPRGTPPKDVGRNLDRSSGTGVSILDPRWLGITGILFSVRMEDEEVGAGGGCGVSWSVGGLRRLMAAISTMYDFVDRQILVTFSASACAFVTRLPFALLRARNLWVGCPRLGASGDREESHTAIKLVRSRLAYSTMIPPYRSWNCCRLSSACLSRKFRMW